MPFDLSSATPVSAETPTAGAGFDLSTAQPVAAAEPEKKRSWAQAAESFGSGVADAAYGLAAKAEHFLPGFQTLEMSRKAVEARSGAEVPTFESIARAREKEIDERRAAEGQTGIDWWRAAGNVANPINYVGGPSAKLEGLGTVYRAALQGGLTSLEQPVKSEDISGESAKQLGVGTVAGGVLGSAVNTIAKAAEPIVSPIMNFIKGIKGPDAIKEAGTQEILRRIGQDIRGGGPTAQDMLDLLSTAPGKPMTLMDVGGENVKALAGRISRAPGEARQIISKFINERDLNAGLRVSDDVNKGIHGGNAFDAANVLAESRSKAAAPLYDAAFKANQNVASPEIDAILATPAGAKALKQAGIKMQNDMTLAGKADPELLQQAKEAGQYIPFRGGIASGLKLRTLDYVKRSLDDQIGAAIRAGEKDEARILTGLKAKFVSELDKADVTAKPGLPGKVGQRAPTAPTPGAYAMARQAYSGMSQSMDALEAGKGFLKSEPQEIAAEVANLSRNDKEFYKIGAATALRKLLAKTGPNGDESKKIIGNAYTRAQLRPLFESDTEYDKFINSVSAEQRMFQTGSEVLGNSRTAARLAEDTDPANQAFAQAAKGGVQAVKGNYLGALSDVMGSIASLARGLDPAVNASMARSLTTPLNGSGMALLRNFASTSPVTRNYLGQLVQPVNTAVVPPLAIGAANYVTQQGQNQ